MHFVYRSHMKVYQSALLRQWHVALFRYAQGGGGIQDVIEDGKTGAGKYMEVYKKD